MLDTRVKISDMRARPVWKFPEFIAAHNIRPFDVYRALDPTPLSPNTIYRWANGMPSSIDLQLLVSIVAALQELTGKKVEISDLIEYRLLRLTTIAGVRGYIEKDVLNDQHMGLNRLPVQWVSEDLESEQQAEELVIALKNIGVQIPEAGMQIWNGHYWTPLSDFRIFKVERVEIQNRTVSAWITKYTESL